MMKVKAVTHHDVIPIVCKKSESDQAKAVYRGYVVNLENSCVSTLLNYFVCALSESQPSFAMIYSSSPSGLDPLGPENSSQLMKPSPSLSSFSQSSGGTVSCPIFLKYASTSLLSIFPSAFVSISTNTFGPGGGPSVMSTTSTSKWSVAPPGMAPPAPAKKCLASSMYRVSEKFSFGKTKQGKVG